MISNQFDSAPAPPRYHFSTLEQLTFSMTNEDRAIRMVLVAVQRARTLVRGVGEVNRIMPELLHAVGRLSNLAAASRAAAAPRTECPCLPGIWPPCAAQSRYRLPSRAPR